MGQVSVFGLSQCSVNLLYFLDCSECNPIIDVLY